MGSGHGGKNRHLVPEFYSMQLLLRFNLEPIHLLDGLIDQILDSTKTYLREEARLTIVVRSYENICEVKYYFIFALKLKPLTNCIL